MKGTDVTTYAVRCGRLFDGTGAPPVRNASLLVEDGRISEGRVPDGVEELDLREHFVMPGLIDAHSHVSIVLPLGDQWAQKRRPAVEQALSAPYNLRQDLEAGTTTLRVMGEEDWLDLHVRDAIRAGHIEGPELICATRPLSPSNGFGRITRGYDGPDEVRKVVRENLHRGADFIKVFATGGAAGGARTLRSEYSAEELRTIVEEAERGGTYVAAHAVGGPGLDDAVRTGVRTIEHAWHATDEQIEALVDADAWVVCTLGVLFSPAGIESGEPDRRPELERTREAVAERLPRLLGSGVRLALGTDHVHGGMAFEIQKAIELGLAPAAALVAATAGGAQALRVDDRLGTLRPGMVANLIALDGDPLEDPGALDRVRCVVKAGVRLR
jgi:imidazolonepropionase-like amidohydrolase